MNKIIILLAAIPALVQSTDLLGEPQNNLSPQEKNISIQKSIVKKKPFTPKIIKIAIYAGLLIAASKLPDKATTYYWNARNHTFDSFLNNIFDDILGQNRTPTTSEFKKYAQIATYCIQGILALGIFEQLVKVVCEVEKRLTIDTQD